MSDEKINASNIPADIILNIVDYASDGYESKDLQLLVLHLCLINRHWSWAVSHTSAYSTGTFTIDTIVDVKRLRRWLAAPLRKLTHKGHLTLNVKSDKIYTRLCHSDRSLANLNIEYLEINFEYRAESYIVPQNLRAVKIRLYGSAEEYSDITPDNFSENLRNNLRELELVAIAPEGFSRLRTLQYSFTRLRAFFLWSNSPTYDVQANAHHIIKLMPNLETLTVEYKPDHGDAPDDAPYNPTLKLPKSMNKLTTLRLRNVQSDLNQCLLPELKSLEHTTSMEASNWGGLGCNLNHIDLTCSNLASSHDLFQSKTFKKLVNVKTFLIRKIRTSFVYDRLKEGFFDNAMPNLEELNISTDYHDVGTVPLKRFIAAHPHLHTVTADGNDDIDASVISKAVDDFITVEDEDARTYDNETDSEDELNFYAY